MKRADITAGMEVYVDGSPSWKDDGGGHTVTVLDAGKWVENGWSFVRHETRKVTVGTGEVVDLGKHIVEESGPGAGVLARYTSGWRAGNISVVSLGSIRGMADECAAIIRQNDEDRKARRVALEAERNDNRGRIAELVERFKAFGIAPTCDNYYRTTTIELNEAEARHLLDLLEAGTRAGDVLAKM